MYRFLDKNVKKDAIIRRRIIYVRYFIWKNIKKYIQYIEMGFHKVFAEYIWLGGKMNYVQNACLENEKIIITSYGI